MIQFPRSQHNHTGATPLLRSTVKAAPGNYHIDIAICDAGDRKYDSAVFVQLDSIAGVNCNTESCGGTGVAPDDVPNGQLSTTTIRYSGYNPRSMGK